MRSIPVVGPRPAKARRSRPPRPSPLRDHGVPPRERRREDRASLDGGVQVGKSRCVKRPPGPEAFTASRTTVCLRAERTDMLGYAAMNRTLRDRDPPRRCNRDMRKKTWESEGLAYAGELAARNFEDLLAILRWNLEHDIRFYRCSSTLVPWNSRFDQIGRAHV